MTDFLNLHALDELVAAATPGPWEARRYSESGHRLSSWSRIDTERHDIADEIDRHADAVAIVALRNAYPGLRSLIDRLTEDRATLVQQNRELAELLEWRRRASEEVRSDMRASDLASALGEAQAELARLRRVEARAAHLLRSRGSAAEEFASSALREELRGEP